MDFFNGGELYHYLSMGRFSEVGLGLSLKCRNVLCFMPQRYLWVLLISTSTILYIGRTVCKTIDLRDLKPENLLLDPEGHIRITDFGLSKEDVEGDTVRSLCGTPEYLAPEILKKQPYGKSVDWWSLGTLIYEMITGLPPFYDNNRKLMYHKILSAPLLKSPYMSPEAFDLCSKLLERDPTKRLGYGGYEEIQKHPWFKEIDWDALYRKEIEPPYKPSVKSAESTEHIDDEFVLVVPAVTPTPVNAVLTDQNAFENFSYAEGVSH